MPPAPPELELVNAAPPVPPAPVVVPPKLMIVPLTHEATAPRARSEAAAGTRPTERRRERIVDDDTTALQ
jgi:hypothetical protein